MGIADRARDALRPTNAIEPAPATSAPAPAAPGYCFSSMAVHPARHFDSAADAAAAFDEAPVQDRPAVVSTLPDGSARYVATTLRIDRQAGVPGFEKSVGATDREFAAAYEATRRATRGPAAAGPGPVLGDDRQPAYAKEPASIARNYYVEESDGERRYFDDYKRKALAMRATDTSISTRREDLNTVRAMIELAQARGWQSVEIRGTAEFRREAWIEATARGLQGCGFTPSDPDQQEADRRRAERGPANEIQAQAVAAQAPHPSGPRAAPKEASKEAPAAATAERPLSHDKGATVLLPADAGKDGQAGPSLADDRKALHSAQKDLSADARLVLAALSEKIDRQMNRHNLEAKAQIKAFVASELVKKERAEGPIVLSAEQKRAAAAPEPAQAAPKAEVAAILRRAEPEAPRRSLAR